MRALTRVPRSLTRDLKRWAFTSSDDAAAGALLVLDADCADTGERTPVHLAHSLAVVAKRLAKVERGARRSLTDAIEARLCREAGPYATDDGASADVMIYADTLRTLGALRRRAERAISRLMLGVRGGRLPLLVGSR